MNKVIYIGGAFALKTLCALIVVRFLASGFGDEGFGYLTQYMAFLAVVFGLSLGGASNYLVKSLSQAEGDNHLDKVISEVFSYGLVFFLLLAIMLVVFKVPLEEYVFYQKVSWWFVAYLLVLFYVSNIYGCLMGVALAQGRIALYALSIVGGAVVYAISAALLVHYDASYLAYWLIPLSYVLPVVFMRGAYGGKIRVDLRCMVEWSRFQKVFRYCLIVYAGLISVPLVSMFVREAFNRDYGNLALSYWQVAVKYSDAQQQFFGTFCATLLLPYLSRHVGLFRFKGWVARLALLSLLYAGAATVIYIFRDEIIFLLFGSGYDEAREYFVYYLVGDYFRMAALFCVFTLISVDRFGRALMFELMQGGIFVMLFYWMSGWGQVQGVGGAYLITYALCFCMMFAYVFDYFRRRAQ
ncbi:hypothetical protein ACIPZG_21920 [Pseudomonas sp. NPDC089395]|uniref:hypothetical protein n=1 Tax=Pseudomonas sp. NPDC089395 TaxID=3364460 RepID=UPI0037F2F0D0